MKKDSFVKGAMVATLCIVFSKILGIIYVIPFHAIIGTNGRALYSYAYNTYMLFLNFSTVGIPLAIAKIVSEYHSLGYEYTKQKSYQIALRIVFAMAIISTLVLLIVAPYIAQTIIGDLKGGNSIDDITYVLRISASAILFVTMLSGVRGYLQGHKYITPSSISQVIEQFIRVLVIIVGSFIAMKLWGTKEAVGIAVFGATAGSIAALIYLEVKMHKDMKKDDSAKMKKEEAKYTTKYLILQLIKYTIPFVVVGVAVTLYNTVDMLSIVRPLVKYGGLKAQEAELVLSVVATWGAKLNSIVTSVAAGVVTSVLPNITSDFVKKDSKEVNRKINQTLQMVLYFVIPMVFGLSFLAEPVWKVFYGTNELSVSVFSYSIFTAIFYSLFLNIHTILQSVNRMKTAAISIVCGLIVKIVFTITIIILFSKIPFIPTYYGSITATILAYIVPITISCIDLKKTNNVKFKETLVSLGKVLLGAFTMLCTLYTMKLFIPLTGSRIYSIIIICVYAGVGGLIYYLVTSKLDVFKNIFGCNLKEFINKRLRRAK